MTHPFKLAPAFKDYLWGGRQLITEYGKRVSTPVLAESWEVSTHPAGLSIIDSGPFAGMTLNSYMERHIAGGGNSSPGGLPVLVKLISTRQPLSIQVHPDDDYAWHFEHQPGKTEMWYVLGADPGATIACGFKQVYSREEVETAIAGGWLHELCNWYPAKAGDVFFIPAGTIHAIGAGIVLAEIQQCSNVTYRVDDYGRLDQNGKPRPLHIDRALDVMRFEPSDDPRFKQYQLRHTPGVTRESLFSCGLFEAKILAISGNQAIATSDDRFISYTCIEGQGMLLADDEMLPILKGDTFAAPPRCNPFSIVGGVVVLETIMNSP